MLYPDRSAAEGRHPTTLNNAGRSDNLARARELLHVAPALPKGEDASDEPVQPTFVCPHCGAAMVVVETLARAQQIRAPPQLRGQQ